MAIPSMWVSVCVGVIQAKCVRRKSGEAISALMSNVASIHGARRKAYDRRPEKVVLLFDCQRPRWADGGGQRETEEVLDEEDVRPPRRCPDCIPHGGADKPWSIEIADDQNQNVNRPDAECAPSVEVAEVARIAARLKQD